MSRFIQLHLLTFYPPSNLNRDDTGRPKTAVVGQKPRIRISSQCLKRSWRTSEVFKNEVEGRLGYRTKKLAKRWVYDPLIEAGIDSKDAKEWANTIGSVFAKIDDKDKLISQQLAHVGVSEKEAVDELVQTLIAEPHAPEKDELDLLRQDHRAVDIAMFGRMFSNNAGYNTEGAVQVSHAFTINQAEMQDDYFTAVDDLNDKSESGSAHLDEAWFSSGVFYTYICINREQLIENLSGNEELADKAIAGLTKAAATVSPSGKQNSFAALSQAGFIYAEKGEDAPRTLALSFLKPIDARGGEDLLALGKAELVKHAKSLNDAYGCEHTEDFSFDPRNGGKFKDLVKFVTEKS